MHVNNYFNKCYLNIYQKTQSIKQSSHQIKTDVCSKINQGCEHTQTRVYQVAKNIDNFVRRNAYNFLYVASTAATAYFAPHLFFPTLIVTAIIRIEATRYLRNIAKEYCKEEKNPFVNHSYPDRVNTTELALAVIAATDAVALGTLFTARSLTVNLIPILGGIAAGNTLGKFAIEGLDYCSQKMAALS